MATSNNQKLETAQLDETTAEPTSQDAGQATITVLSTENLGRELPPAAGLKEIRDREIFITGRSQTEVPFDTARDGKYGRPNENGNKVISTIETRDGYTVPVKGEETENVRNFFVSESAYKMLNALANGNAAAVDAAFAAGGVAGPIVPCKLKGKQNTYWAWLPPAKYEQAVKDGKVSKD